MMVIKIIMIIRKIRIRGIRIRIKRGLMVGGRNCNRN
jgi:hypothetical protein